MQLEYLQHMTTVMRVEMRLSLTWQQVDHFAAPPQMWPLQTQLRHRAHAVSLVHLIAVLHPQAVLAVGPSMVGALHMQLR